MKKYTVKLLAAAEKEVAEACEWYDERQLGLGKKLLIEISIYITQIAENPFAFNVRFSENTDTLRLKFSLI